MEREICTILIVIAMKKIIGILILLIICGCINKKKSEQKDVPPFPENITIEYENHSIPLFEENIFMRAVLDSVTESINNCPKIKNGGEVLYISFNTLRDTLNIMSIDLMRRKDLYCDYIAGIIAHNNRYFILNQTFTNDSLFRNTGLVVDFKCRKEDMFRHDPKDWFIGWSYVLYNGNFKCISYDFCGKSWYDKKYFDLDKSE